MRPINYVKPTTPKQRAQDIYADFESVRYYKPLQQQTTQLQQLINRRPTEILPNRIDLAHVIKSLQLTNRLPEILDKNNIDSSIRTLEEILDLLNMGRKKSYQQPGKQLEKN